MAGPPFGIGGSGTYQRMGPFARREPVYSLGIGVLCGPSAYHPPALAPRHREVARMCLWWRVHFPGIPIWLCSREPVRSATRLARCCAAMARDGALAVDRCARWLKPGYVRVRGFGTLLAYM